MEKQLHPKIKEFKDFVKQHPKIISDVRSGNKNWQELYEDWYLLGENDDIWSKYKDKIENETTSNSNDSKSDVIGKLFATIKNVDINDVSHHISNVNSAITAIQSILSQFQSSKQPTTFGKANVQQRQHPFSFRKD